MVHTFGTAHGQKIDDERCEEASPQSEELCTVIELRNAAEAGDEEAIGALCTIAYSSPRMRDTLGMAPLSNRIIAPPVQDDELKWAMDVCKRVRTTGAMLPLSIGPPRATQGRLYSGLN
jgi:hypothetical protein